MIVVDERAGSRDLLDCPDLADRAVPGFLEFGDVLLTGHGPDGSVLSIGVEVKKMGDLLSSISNGRLGGTQLPGMIKEYGRGNCWILSYGEYKAGEDNKLKVRRWVKRKLRWQTYRIGAREVPWAFLEGALLTYAMKGGVRHKHTADIHEAAKWLAVLDNWLEKRWDDHRGMQTFDHSREQAPPPEANPVETQIAKTAASFEFLDWSRGWAVAEKFDSVWDFVTADRKELMEVDGIGKVISDSLYRSIRRKK